MRTVVRPIAILVLFISFAVSGGAQTPDAPWYKKAPEEINLKAKVKLENALSAKPEGVNTEALFAKAVFCGPLLWDALKGRASKELVDALAVDVHIRMPEAVTKEARAFAKPEQKRLFWKQFIESIRASALPSVRVANRAEIDYYWSTISFDIEEPLYVAELGKFKVLFNFVVTGGEPEIFWMDIVGDLAGAK